MVDYSKHTTNKYECNNCHQKKMYPNASDNRIMGYVCSYCSSINYPHKDKLADNK